jgi:N-acetylglucosamine-6-phosphate deacetylase
MIQVPSIELFTRFWEAAEGKISIMTIAPEVDGALELIEHAKNLGVRVSLGHSDADTAEAERGIAAGARSATHTYNAMRALDHRDPGLLGTVLDTDSLYAELICDGVHVHPALVRLFWKAKGRERAILITDGISATGMPEGDYLLGGLTVTVKDGRCMHGGTLAGSVLTLDRAVRNFREFTTASLADTVALVTKNPAALTGVDHAHGVIAAGRGCHRVFALGRCGCRLPARPQDRLKPFHRVTHRLSPSSQSNPICVKLISPALSYSQRAWPRENDICTTCRRFR